MYRLSDLMQMFNIPERTIRRHISEGVLKGEKAGGTWRFTEEDILSYINVPLISQRLSKTAVKNVFDYLNGYSIDNDEMVIIKKIKKPNYAISLKISLIANSINNPLYFNMTNHGSSSIITFKGKEEDSIYFVNELNKLIK